MTNARFKVSGVATPQSTYRKRSRIFESKKMIGVTSYNGKVQNYTNIQLYVPMPGHAGELPGIFLTLSNGRGQCFTRISEADLAALYDWLSLLRDPLLSALQQATTRHEQYKDAESQVLRRNAHQNSHSSQEEDQKDIGLENIQGY